MFGSKQSPKNGTLKIILKKGLTNGLKCAIIITVKKRKEIHTMFDLFNEMENAFNIFVEKADAFIEKEKEREQANEKN